MMLRILEERNFPVSELLPVASSASIGKNILFGGQEIPIISAKKALERNPSIALFSAGGGPSTELAPRFADAGTVVIDNSSAWRMHPDCKLIVPEVNGYLLDGTEKIIANPNCSTIQMMLVLKPLHDCYGLRRVVVSTYQSVTGTGVKAVNQLMNERAGITGEMAYPYPIDLNVIPQVDVFLDNGYTKEEMKMVNESRKILGIPDLRLTATTVRIPVMGAHSESLNIEFEKEFNLTDIHNILSKSPGIVVQDNPKNKEYPMPLFSGGLDDVFVGRIRRDESMANSLNCWVVSDNLRKGAATNAVQIAELLLNFR